MTSASEIRFEVELVHCDYSNGGPSLAPNSAFAALFFSPVNMFGNVMRTDIKLQAERMEDEQRLLPHPIWVYDFFPLAQIFHYGSTSLTVI